MLKHAIVAVSTLAVMFISVITTVAAWDMPTDGFATMTHYDLPSNAIASCGCTAQSDHYPTAALSDLAWNSSNTVGFSPACGRCFRVELINTIASDPVWYLDPAEVKSVVIKITDHCPRGGAWCNATDKSPNAAGLFVNFDLAWPSKNGALPDDFFPTNASYGYDDFGVWNVSYSTIPCTNNWAGMDNAAALGSVAGLGDSVCCPADPIMYPNTTCPSAGTPPNSTTTGGSVYLGTPTPAASLLASVVAIVVALFTCFRFSVYTVE